MLKRKHLIAGLPHFTHSLTLHTDTATKKPLNICCLLDSHTSLIHLPSTLTLLQRNHLTVVVCWTPTLRASIYPPHWHCYKETTWQLLSVGLPHFTHSLILHTLATTWKPLDNCPLVPPLQPPPPPTHTLTIYTSCHSCSNKKNNNHCLLDPLTLLILFTYPLH